MMSQLEATPIRHLEPWESACLYALSQAIEYRGVPVDHVIASASTFANEVLVWPANRDGETTAGAMFELRGTTDLDEGVREFLEEKATAW